MDDATTPTWASGEPSRRHPRRTPLLLTLAVVPWLALGLLGWRGLAADVPDTAPAATASGRLVAPASDPPGGAAAAPPPPAPPPSAEPPAPATGDRAPHPAGAATDGDAAAVAIAVARTWLAAPGAPELAVEGLGSVAVGYLEHATVRRLEVVSEDAVVATVSALVLTIEDGAYAEVHHLEIGVPLHVAGGRVTPAGAPWWGPTSLDLTPTVRPGTPLADEAHVRHAAEEALRAAGHREVTVGRIEDIAPSLVRAEVRARTTAGLVHDGPVWFARDGDAVRLLGPGGTPAEAGPDLTVPERPDASDGTDGDTPQPTDPHGQEPT